jgi:aquaporin Z
MTNTQRGLAEMIGTFWLVFGGCGSAVIACNIVDVGIGFVGVSLAFGLTVLTMAYTIGHISGCHLNPAVTLGLWAGGRFPTKDIPLYIVAQVVGAIIAAALVYSIASGLPDFEGGVASNGLGDLSPAGYSFQAGITIEMVLTFMFLIVILGSTDTRAPAGFAPIAIGLCLTLIHLISIPVTNTSVNPARSTGPALIEAFYGSGGALSQLFWFWVAPIIGALISGYVYKVLGADSGERPPVEGEPLS